MASEITCIHVYLHSWRLLASWWHCSQRLFACTGADLVESLLPTVLDVVFVAAVVFVVADAFVVGQEHLGFGETQAISNTSKPTNTQTATATVTPIQQST